MMPTIPTWKPTIAKLWRKSQTIAEWRLPITLFVCGLLAYGGAFAWHMLANYDLVNLIRYANYDDSFYYFQIAYNLAQGKFSTFDGGITQTNGYHPVWMLLITPFYWLFDKETALFGIKAFEIALVAGGVAIITLAAWLSRLAWPLLFAALPLLYSNPARLLFGLEAAAAMFTLSMFILAVCVYMRHPQRWKWHIAALAFALPWVRIEYIAVSLAVTAALCVIEWSRMERRSLRLSALANLWHAYIPIIGAAAGILVYFAYNRLAFGGILPVSAAVRRAWSQGEWEREGGYDFVQNFLGTLRLDAFDNELLPALEICAYLLIAWRLALRSNDRRDWLLVAFLVGVFGLAAGHIAKFLQSVLIMHPNHASQIWYFVPAYMTEALIIPVRLYIAIWLIRRFVAPRWSATANALSVGVFIIGAAFLLGRTDFTEPFKRVKHESRATYRETEITAYMGAQVMNRALPEGSVIGSWDAGVIGYFSRFPVVNMDGYVNSYDHFHARYIQRTEGLDFYRRYGVTHFANNLSPSNVPGNVIFEGASIDSQYIDRQFRIWTYGAPAEAQDEIHQSHWVWERMKPHFDHLAGDVGVILDGRMAQAFVKDCDPDEPLVWTWQENEKTIELENQLIPGLTAMCVDTRVLSHNARPPVQAKATSTNDYIANLTRYYKPVIRSDFDVYITDYSLIYAKSKCGPEDTAARFFASLFPVDPNDLPDDRKRRGYEAIEFDFADYGATADDGNCWAEIALPDYPVREIHAGQHATGADGYDYSWDATYKVGVGSYRAGGDADFEMLAGNEPIISSDFDVYLIDRRLIYAKRQCSQEDVAARFFASVFPAYPHSLPPHLRQIGYGSLEFKIDGRDITAAGNCWAEIVLPNYLIADIHTGQYVATADGYDHLWEGNIYRISAAADFESLEGRKPIIRSDFDVYLIDGSLTYTKTQCSQEDVEAIFFISVVPVDANDLRDDLKQSGYYPIHFNFGDYGAITDDGRCWHGGIRLPDYPFKEIHIGQSVETEDGYHYPWDAVYKVGAGSYRADAAADFGRLEGRKPIIRSDFDAYLIDDSLIYTKTQCSQDDMEARVVVTIFPGYDESLPDYLRRLGYGSLEFKFDERNITADGSCWAEVLLPDYPIAEIHTGQYVEVEGGYEYLWDATYKVGAGSYSAGAAADFGKLEGHTPIIRSNFDVYLIDGSLIYTKHQCSDADASARFSLGVFPTYANSLPEHIRRLGYGSLEFKFDERNITADGSCWAEALLPDYPIAEIHTGQYAVAEDGYEYLWQRAYHPE